MKLFRLKSSSAALGVTYPSVVDISVDSMKGVTAGRRLCAVFRQVFLLQRPEEYFVRVGSLLFCGIDPALVLCVARLNKPGVVK
jgi:hypothetical protein